MKIDDVLDERKYALFNAFIELDDYDKEEFLEERDFSRPLIKYAKEKQKDRCF